MNTSTRFIASLVLGGSLILGCGGEDYPVGLEPTGIESSTQAIHNGTLSNDPATVLVRLGGGSCTGVAISPHVILTAAHCVTDTTTGAVLGTSSLIIQTLTGSIQNPTQVLRHPDYDPNFARRTLTIFPGGFFRTTSVDIALLAVASELPAHHELATTHITEGFAANIVGFGEDRGNDAQIQRSGKIDVFSNQTVDGTSVVFTRRHSAAPGVVQTGCRGDSGSGLFDPDTGHVAGILSVGRRAIAGRCVVTFTTTYVDTVTYRPWISTNTEALEPMPSQWQNRPHPTDVNDDGQVSPIDVLTVITDVNVNGARNLVTSGAPPPTGPNGIGFVDVNGDGSVSPLDVLEVINDININGTRVLPVAPPTPPAARPSVDHFALRAQQVDCAYGLRFPGSYWPNFLGLQEKWVRDARGYWYFVLSTGEMFTYNREYIATFSPAHYTDPALLHEACP